MSQCLPSTTVPVGSIERCSVHHYGAAEADRHKWLESEKAGRDLGEAAIRSWIREHWNGFLRAMWLEHLQGKRFWIELDHGDFGLLTQSFPNSDLIQIIVDMLKNGRENLGVLNWAIDNALPMAEILDILESLDINSRRIECQFEPLPR